MNDYFEWNGISSSTYGLRVSKFGALPVPVKRVETEVIPGRSGNITIAEGEDVFDTVSYTIEFWVSDAERISEIAAWLNGNGILRIPIRRNGVYKARVSSDFDFEKIAAVHEHRTTEVNFELQPFFIPDTNDIMLTTPGNVKNDYAFYSMPIITVYGKGTQETIMIGDSSLLIDNLDGNIRIDCENKLAVMNGENACLQVSVVNDDFPTLEPGDNMVNWTSGIRSVEISPNWRTL